MPCGERRAWYCGGSLTGVVDRRAHCAALQLNPTSQGCLGAHVQCSAQHPKPHFQHSQAQYTAAIEGFVLHTPSLELEGPRDTAGCSAKMMAWMGLGDGSIGAERPGHAHRARHPAGRGARSDRSLVSSRILLSSACTTVDTCHTHYPWFHFGNGSRIRSQLNWRETGAPSERLASNHSTLLIALAGTYR